MAPYEIAARGEIEDGNVSMRISCRREGVSVEIQFSAIKLAAFDVDGTILRGENICGCIARNIGSSVEMDAFELLRSQDEIAAGREAMLEWHAPFGSANLIGHLSELRLAPGVKEGFARLKDGGVKIALVSITWKFAVGWLASELGADFAVGTGWQRDGTIAHFGRKIRPTI
ncbi:Hypothetical protein NGAL_HAMBI1145_52690 [Neorhizobium galegae bv. officinalis]|uniref:Uncharacterized protein n=1 Tax=Neorhizobium galegae bv. officinalis TaxID=323656 RepID=A0A0T7FYT7_NEOGA|nr:hypothetical protein [Neorhizobium galegae]CDZ40189.1 Hypothetical protein NGAL_HAMBI1145_52690 [Neorhizobium galegae bv. officinalis]